MAADTWRRTNEAWIPVNGDSDGESPNQAKTRGIRFKHPSRKGSAIGDTNARQTDTNTSDARTQTHAARQSIAEWYGYTWSLLIANVDIYEKNSSITLLCRTLAFDSLWARSSPTDNTVTNYRF